MAVFGRPDRLLDPVWMVRCEAARPLYRFLDVPKAVAIDHQWNVVTEDVARRLHVDRLDLVDLHVTIAAIRAPAQRNGRRPMHYPGAGGSRRRAHLFARPRRASDRAEGHRLCPRCPTVQCRSPIARRSLGHCGRRHGARAGRRARSR